MTLDLAALLEQCQATHDADLAEVFARTQRAAETLVRRVAFGGASRADFEDYVTFGCMQLPDETPDRFDARRRGLLAGLISGICAVSAR